MNIIALLQLLKNTEGETGLFKQTLEFAIKINSFERTPAVYPISMARLGYAILFPLSGIRSKSDAPLSGERN